MAETEVLSAPVTVILLAGALPDPPDPPLIEYAAVALTKLDVVKLNV